jgi:hypothetical protein
MRARGERNGCEAAIAHFLGHASIINRVHRDVAGARQRTWGGDRDDGNLGRAAWLLEWHKCGARSCPRRHSTIFS